MAPAYRLIQRGPDRAVGLVGGSRRAAVSQHSRVQLLQVLRLQQVETVPADSRNQVLPDSDAVAVERVNADHRRGDVVEPVHEPLLYRPALAGLADGACLPLPLQLPNLLRDVSLGLALDVSAVGLPVVLDAYRHPPVPVAVLAW